MKTGWLTKYFYRRKALGIIIGENEEFLIDQLVNYGNNDWNFPGGGIETNETEEEALLRELKEELGTDKFVILKKSKYLITYNWPISVVIRRLKKDKKLWFGQSARYFLVKFTGKQNDVNPDPGEIRKIKWIKRNEFKNYLIFPNQLRITEEQLKQLS